jgi:hypothetical protein
MLNSIVKELLSPAEGGVSRLGKAGKLTPEAILACLADLSTTCSVGWLPCRTIFNPTEENGSCQEALKKTFWGKM